MLSQISSHLELGLAFLFHQNNSRDLLVDAAMHVVGFQFRFFFVVRFSFAACYASVLSDDELILAFGSSVGLFALSFSNSRSPLSGTMKNRRGRNQKLGISNPSSARLLLMSSRLIVRYEIVWLRSKLIIKREDNKGVVEQLQVLRSVKSYENGRPELIGLSWRELICCSVCGTSRIRQQISWCFDIADERDSDSVKDRARMSALLLHRLIQKGYLSLMANILYNEKAVEN
ncbi:hypothetical protein LINPERPRIM_LOCUS34078 [Linum perenne]